MRLALTAVWPARGQRVNVVIDADPATVVGQIAAGLARAAGVRAGDGTGAQLTGRGRDGRDGTALFVDGHPVSPRLALAESPLLQGCVVSVGDPPGYPPGGSAGIAEVRVAGGPAAGMVHVLGPAGPISAAGRGRPSPSRTRSWLSSRCGWAWPPGAR